MSPAVSRIVYKPVSLLISVAGGAVAGAVFKKVWKVVGDDAEAPKPTALDHSAREVFVAAAVHGLVFGLVKAAVERMSAKGYRKLTGNDPER